MLLYKHRAQKRKCSLLLFKPTIQREVCCRPISWISIALVIKLNYIDSLDFVCVCVCVWTHSARMRKLLKIVHVVDIFSKLLLSHFTNDWQM